MSRNFLPKEVIEIKISSPVSSRFNKFKKIIIQRYLMNLWYGILQFNAILVLFALPSLVNSSSIVCIMHRSIRFILLKIVQRMSVKRCYKMYDGFTTNLSVDTFWVSSVNWLECMPLISYWWCLVSFIWISFYFRLDHLWVSR